MPILGHHVRPAPCCRLFLLLLARLNRQIRRTSRRLGHAPKNRQTKYANETCTQAHTYSINQAMLCPAQPATTTATGTTRHGTWAGQAWSLSRASASRLFDSKGSRSGFLAKCVAAFGGKANKKHSFLDKVWFLDLVPQASNKNTWPKHIFGTPSRLLDNASGPRDGRPGSFWRRLWT